MENEKPNYFCVISVKSDQYDEVKEHVLTYNKFHCSVIVEEFGQGGDHPHLNVLFYDNPDRRTDSITRAIKRYLTSKTGYEYSANSIRTKVITDINGLVKYIVKEDACNILRNEPSLDLSRNNLIEFFSIKDVKWQKTLTLNNAPLIYVQYCKALKLEVDNVDHNLHLMTRDRINVIAILRHIKVFRQVLKYLTKEPNFETPSVLTMMDM